MTRSQSRRRARVGLAAIAVIAGLLPATPALGSHVTTRNTDPACADAPEDGFNDTGSEGSAQEEAVDCIAWYRITSGTSQTTYSPTRQITREQMATFIAQSLRQSDTDFTEPAAADDAFDDDEASRHETNINFVAKHEVVQGTASRRFEPARSVTREQMASFIVNQLTAIGADLPAPRQDYFDDDDASVHHRNINVLAELGIATGRTDRGYEPVGLVTRGQMALFISRDLAELVEQRLLQTPAQQATVTLDSTSVRQGEAVTGTVTATKTIRSVTLSGCGLNNEPVEDTDTGKAGIQFRETIPASQPAGSCTLTFTVTFDDGSRETQQKTITVTTGLNEAAAGAHTSVDVKSVDRGNDSFVGTTDAAGHGDETFVYDPNDAFQRAGGAGMTLAQFENLLTAPAGTTPGDVLDVTYDPDRTKKSTFTVTTDNVPPASNVTATVTDADNDNAQDDVRISWTASAQPDAVYDVFRDSPTTNDNTIGVDDTQVASDVSVTTITVINQPNGSYNYLVRAESTVTGSQSATAASGDVTVIGSTGPEPTITGGPRSQRAIRVEGTSTSIQRDDRWRFAFDKPLAPVIEPGDRLRLVEGFDAVQSPPEEVFELIHDTDTLTLNATSTTVGGVSYGPNQVLTVLVDTTSASLTYPVTVQISPGLTGNAGEPIDWDGSPDRTVEAQLTPSGPTMTSATGSTNATAPDTIVVRYSELVSCTLAEPGQFRYDPSTATPGNEVAAIIVTCNSEAVTLTFPDGVFRSGSATDQLTYTQSTDPNRRIKSAQSGLDAQSPQSIAVSG